MHGIRSMGKADHSSPIPTFSDASPIRGGGGGESTLLRPTLSQCFPSPIRRLSDQSLSTSSDLEAQQCYALGAITFATPNAHLLLLTTPPEISTEPESLSTAQHLVVRLLPQGPTFLELKLTPSTTREEISKALYKADAARSTSPPPAMDLPSAHKGPLQASSMQLQAPPTTVRRGHHRVVSTVSSDGCTELSQHSDEMDTLASGQTGTVSYSVVAGSSGPQRHLQPSLISNSHHSHQPHYQPGAKNVLVIHDLHCASPTVLGVLIEALQFNQVMHQNSTRALQYLRCVAVCDGNQLKYLPTLLRGSFLLSMSLSYQAVAAQAGAVANRRMSQFLGSTVNNMSLSQSGASSSVSNILSPQLWAELTNDMDLALDPRRVYLNTTTQRYFEQSMDIVTSTVAPWGGASGAGVLPRQSTSMLRALQVAALLFSQSLPEDDLGGTMLEDGLANTAASAGVLGLSSSHHLNVTLGMADSVGQGGSRSSRRVLVTPTDAVCLLPFFVSHVLDVPMRQLPNFVPIAVSTVAPPQANVGANTPSAGAGSNGFKSEGLSLVSSGRLASFRMLREGTTDIITSSSSAFPSHRSRSAFPNSTTSLGNGGGAAGTTTAVSAPSLPDPIDGALWDIQQVLLRPLDQFSFHEEIGGRDGMGAGGFGSPVTPGGVSGDAGLDEIAYDQEGHGSYDDVVQVVLHALQSYSLPPDT